MRDRYMMEIVVVVAMAAAAAAYQRENWAK